MNSHSPYGLDGGRRARDLVEASSDRLERALDEAPVCAEEAASISKKAFAQKVADPGGIDAPFRGLDHMVLKTAGRVALSTGKDEIDHKSLRQAVGVWKGHAGHYTNIGAARRSAAEALAKLREEALPHKKPQLDAARRSRRFLDALDRADRATRRSKDG